MRLFLNENEIVDGVCVYVANMEGGSPEEVNVKELRYHKNDEVSVQANYYNNRFTLNSEQICEGIRQFLEEYHSFNPIVINTVELNCNEEGIYALVTINE